MDLSQIPTEDLMKMRGGPQPSSIDLSNISTEDLMRMRAPEKPPVAASFARQAGLAARAAGPIAAGAAVGGAVGLPIAGVGAVPGAAAGAAAMTILQLVDKLGGTDYIGKAMDMMGLPNPETGQERVFSDVAGAMSGQAGVMKGGELMARSAGPVVSRVGDLLRSQPAGQLAAAGAGAGASGGVREGGGGPVAQTVAGLAGGMGAPEAANLAIALPRAVGRGIKHIMEPWKEKGLEQVMGRTANEAAGVRKPEVIEELTANKQLVPSSQPTAGEAAAPAGSAEFSALQKTVSKRLPSSYDEIARDQDAARVLAVRSVGKEKTALDAAIAARSAEAQKNYGDAFAQAVKSDQRLKQISKNPYVADALSDAVKLAEAKGITAKGDLTEFLHYVKLSLDKAIGRTGDTALSNTERRSVESAKMELVDWLSKKNLAYEKAREAFAAASKPINQMEVGQYLESKLVPALADSGASPSQRAASFAQAVRDAPATLKKATGFPRFEELGQVLTPAQEQAVKGVTADLGRKARFEQLATAGKPAIAKQLGESLGPTGVPNLLSRPAMIAHAVMKRLEGEAEGKTLQEMAVRMQNPEEMVRLMLNAKPAERSILMEYVMQSRNPALIGAIQGAFRPERPKGVHVKSGPSQMTYLPSGEPSGGPEWETAMAEVEKDRLRRKAKDASMKAAEERYELGARRGR